MEACARDPRKNPRIGDELKDEADRHMLVTAVYRLRSGRRGYQVCYTVLPEDGGQACGLSNWRRIYKRAEVLRIAG